MEASPSHANSGLVFVNFNQDFGCFVTVTSEGFRIFNSDPLRQNKTECKSFFALAETVKNEGENTNVYLGPTLSDVVDGKARVVKVRKSSKTFIFVNAALDLRPIFSQGCDKQRYGHEYIKLLQLCPQFPLLYVPDHQEPKPVSRGLMVLILSNDPSSPANQINQITI